MSENTSSSRTTSATTTLLITPDSRLGVALQVVCKSIPNKDSFRIIERKRQQQTTELDCIATNLGTAFVFVEDITQTLPSNAHSLRLLVLILNLSSIVKSQNFRPEKLVELQMRPNSLQSLAHNAEEAAEFVVSLASKLSNEQAMNQAKHIIFQAYERPYMNLKQTAFEIAEKGFPIPKDESHAMLESLGSLFELVSCGSLGEIAERTPLSDRDASIVAQVLGLTLVTDEPAALAIQPDHHFPSGWRTTPNIEEKEGAENCSGNNISSTTRVCASMASFFGGRPQPRYAKMPKLL